ncbi:MAG: GAF domain-containing protein [Thermoplasmata archaeon]|nr:GAF domain-containing protein [Thermoplasmata archaeon]
MPSNNAWHETFKANAHQSGGIGLLPKRVSPTSHLPLPDEPLSGSMFRSLEARFSVLDVMPDEVCIVRDDRVIVFMNRRMREKFGDVTGKKCYESPFASPDVCNECPFGSDIGDIDYPHKRMVNTHRGNVFEITANRFDEIDNGSSYLVSVVRDITEHSDAEVQVSRLASSIDQLSEAVALFDNDGRSVYANEAFISLMGMSPQEVFGCSLEEISASAALDIPVKEVLRVARDTGWCGEVSGPRKDGSRFFVHIDAKPVRDQGSRVLGMVATFRDVTRERLEKADMERHRSQLEQRMEERTSELAHRVNQLTIINKISRAVTSILDPENLMEEFSRAIADGFSYPIVMVLLWNGDNGDIVFKAGYGKDIGSVSEDLRPKLKEGIIGHSAYFLETLVTGDVDADPRYIRGSVTSTKSEIAVPLTYRGELLGILDIQSEKRNAFTQNDVTVLEMLGDILSTALINARTFSELKERENALSALDRISKQISMRLEPKVVLDQVARDAATLLNAEKALVGIINPDNGIMEWVSLYNVDIGTLEKLRETVEVGVTGRVLKRMTTEIVNDYPSDPDAVTRDASAMGIQSMMSAPLISEGRATGVVSVYNRLDDRRFSKSDAILLSSLADHAAIALENADLLFDLNRRVHSQLILLDTAVSLQREIDSSSMYQLVAEKLDQVVGYDSITIYMVDHENDLMVPVVASGRNADKALQERFPTGEGVSGHVARTGIPEIVNNTAVDERAVYVAGTENDPEDEALMAVPLNGRKRVLGVLTMYREASKRFTGVERDIAQLFANQAAVAVENSELYATREHLLEDTQRKISQMAKVLDVTTSVMYMDALGAVLQRVTDSVVESFGFKRATISLLDNTDRGEFVLFATTGYPHWVQKGMVFEADFILEGFEEEFRASKTAHYLPFERQKYGVERFYFLAHPERANIPRESPDAWHERDLLMFALRDRSDRLVGYMIVDEPFDNKVPKKDQLEVLEILAGMASIAIVNSKLYDNQVEAVNEIALLNDLMTHDINNFNQGIMGYLELLLQDKRLHENQRKYAESALVQVRNNARLIDNMRTLAKVRSMSDNRFTHQDIGKAVDEAISVVTKINSDRDVVVKSSVQSGKHFMMANDSIRDMFANIISNAVKFDSSKRVKVEVSITGMRASENEYWLMKVTDRGRGIPDDRKKTVFERFATGMTGIKGFGLGLSIVRTLVDKFGGKIWVEDRVKGDFTKGSVFKIMLPRVEPPE